MATFHNLFSEFGLPKAIRSDNGVPFASRSYFGLSKLSVLWVRLGIRIERIEPGQPQQNGCHERMHRTLKADATKPPSANIISQQERLDAFKDIFNRDRPHEAIGMLSPETLYKPSGQAYNPDIDPLSYPDHDITSRITQCGQLFIDNKRLQVKLFVGVPFGGYNVGLKRLEGEIWRADFMNFNLGYFDLENQKLQIPTNPFLNPVLN